MFHHRWYFTKTYKRFYFVDSLDEVPGKPRRGEPLCKYAGMDPSLWEKIVVSVRPEWMEEQHVGVRDIFDGPLLVVDIQPFDHEDARSYVSKMAVAHVDATNAAKQSDDKLSADDLADARKSMELIVWHSTAQELPPPLLSRSLTVGLGHLRCYLAPSRTGSGGVPGPAVDSWLTCKKELGC